MTKVIYQRTGGALGQEINISVDLASLPASETHNLMTLIGQSDFFAIPENLAAQSTPDEFQYTITVEAERSKHTIHTSDTTMPNSLRPLLNELTMLAATE